MDESMVNTHALTTSATVRRCSSCCPCYICCSVTAKHRTRVDDFLLLLLLLRFHHSVLFFVCLDATLSSTLRVSTVVADVLACGIHQIRRMDRKQSRAPPPSNRTRQKSSSLIGPITVAYNGSRQDPRLLLHRSAIHRAIGLVETHTRNSCPAGRSTKTPKHSMVRMRYLVTLGIGGASLMTRNPRGQPLLVRLWTQKPAGKTSQRYHRPESHDFDSTNVPPSMQIPVGCVVSPA